MKRFFQIQIIVAIIALPYATLAQVPTITTRIDKNNIVIGQQIEMQVLVKMPDNAFRLTWFSEPTDFGTFVIASKEKIDSAYGNGVLSFSQNLSVTSFDSGRQVIPPLEFSFEFLQKDSSFSMYTDSIPVNVTYSPADSVLPFHDIKPIIQVKKENEWWFWPSIIAIAILLIILLVLYFRRKKKKIPENIFDNTLSAYDEAQKSFEELKTQHLPEKERYNIFFTGLSDIVKKYLSRKQNINLMSLTGSELISTLNDMMPREKLSRVASSIKMGEAAKFAKFQPSQQDCKESIEEMQKLIEDIHTSSKPPADDV